MKGKLVDIPNRRIYNAELIIENGHITAIHELDEEQDNYILPGFVDAHVHIESSMVLPTAFAEVALKHGTVATVSDPHEIGNVLGVSGVEYMIENGKQSSLKFYFGAPSCVPATAFESAGATINPADIEYLLSKPEVLYLAEMMNYPGVIFEDGEVLEKLAIAKRLGKPIDGHAPGVRGKDAEKYFAAGISTDHECFTYEEALEKLKLGVKILIREGSAAKNYKALAPLITEHSKNLMFCSDDKHPDDLLEGHINALVRQAISEGYNLFDVLQMACINPVEHYGLDVGMLRVGDPADFIVVEELKQFNVLKTLIGGELVMENGRSPFSHTPPSQLPNQFNCAPISEKQLSVRFQNSNSEKNKIRVIHALDGELITKELQMEPKLQNGEIVADMEHDILKMVVINRYQNADPAIAFIHGFKLESGAIASSVAHDCHNIVAVGTSDKDLAEAINLVIQHKGGISVVNDIDKTVLPLPIAGIMSSDSTENVGHQYSELDKKTKQLGSTLKAPFMTLSFMALLVIPDLKLSDKGLFSGSAFDFVSLEV